MATNYPSSSSQRDIQALYTESPLPANMLYLNYSSSGSYSDPLVGSSHSQLNNVELPVPNNILLQGSSVEEQDMVSSHLGDHQYNGWRDGRNELSFMQTVGGSINTAEELVHSSVTDNPQMGLGMQLSILSGQNLSLQQSNLSSIQGQGLSLSLGNQISASSFQFRPPSSNVSFAGSHQTSSGNVESTRDDNSRDKHMHMYSSAYGLSTLATTIPNSKYLKAAQQLLDEVVNVRKALKSKLDKNQSLTTSAGNTSCKESDEGSKSDEMPANPQESTANSANELSATERQDLQNKMTKLLAMLDEVDRRYKQYYNQMQIVVSSFDVVAGCGAAKPYTALALQTISRHFRCLKDAISGQIRSTRKSLGEQDNTSKGGGISRLRYIDQHLRQQRAFQHLGMMQQHAWRPQRGLPENSVTILRAWLFEHFLHPYPKDSDKIMLARQTGLTRSQVSNWFINARVRLWKPMVEEMYKEEIGDPEIDSNSSSENVPKRMDEVGSPEDRDDYHGRKSSTERSQFSQFNDSSKSSFLPDVGMDGSATSFQNEVNANLKPKGLRTNVEDTSLFQDTLISDGSGRFMAYQLAELGRYSNSGVSLTLGLQHCEGGGLPVSDGQHSFVSVRGDDMFNAAAPSSLVADTADYNYMNLTDSRHRFGPSQLLHDFVA